MSRSRRCGSSRSGRAGSPVTFVQLFCGVSLITEELLIDLYRIPRNKGIWRENRENRTKLQGGQSKISPSTKHDPKGHKKFC